MTTILLAIASFEQMTDDRLTLSMRRHRSSHHCRSLTDHLITTLAVYSWKTTDGDDGFEQLLACRLNWRCFASWTLTPTLWTSANVAMVDCQLGCCSEWSWPHGRESMMMAACTVIGSDFGVSLSCFGDEDYDEDEDDRCLGVTSWR